VALEKSLGAIEATPSLLWMGLPSSSPHYLSLGNAPSQIECYDIDAQELAVGFPGVALFVGGNQYTSKVQHSNGRGRETITPVSKVLGKRVPTCLDQQRRRPSR
jgi:hypothetical protein